MQMRKFYSTFVIPLSLSNALPTNKRVTPQKTNPTKNKIRIYSYSKPLPSMSKHTHKKSRIKPLTQQNTSQSIPALHTPQTLTCTISIKTT